MKATHPKVMIFVQHGVEGEAADFYQRAFNFDRMEDYAHKDEVLSVHMRSHGLTIVVAGSNPRREADPTLGGPFHPKAPGNGGMFLRMPVSDIEVAVEQAARAGAVIRDEVAPNDVGGRTAILLDPFNHLWALDEDVLEEMAA